MSKERFQERLERLLDEEDVCAMWESGQLAEAMAAQAELLLFVIRKAREKVRAGL